MTWRLARCLEILREEVNAQAPNRSKLSDGTIGDAAHAARRSDHNPNTRGVVQALDVTHDPNGGLNADRLAEYVRARAKKGDKRVKYIIWNHKIATSAQDWAWRAYDGTNPHTKHVHISVSDDPNAYDSDKPWGFAKERSAVAGVPRDELPLKKGHRDGKNKRVSKLQKVLGVKVDGRFQSDTEKAVRRWQALHDGKGRKVPRGQGLDVTGIVDAKTWRALFAKSTGEAAPVASSSKNGETEPDRRRTRLSELVAEVQRLEAQSDRAWERLVAHGIRQNRMAAGAEKRDVAAILLRIEAKLGMLLESERQEDIRLVLSEVPAEASVVPAEQVAELSIMPERPPVPEVTVTMEGPVIPAPAANGPTASPPTGNGSAEKPSKRTLGHLSDEELVEHIERLDRALARSRDALIYRYVQAEKKLARLASAPRPQRRSLLAPPEPRQRLRETAQTVDVPPTSDSERRYPTLNNKQSSKENGPRRATSATPDEIRSLQRRLNQFTDRHLKDVGPVLVDGVLGPSTRTRIKTAKFYLGFADDEHKSPAITPEFLQRLRHPGSTRFSSPGALARAMRRRRNQHRDARRSAAPQAGIAKFEGKPVASWLLPHLEWAREHGWTGMVLSGYRTPEYSESICIRMCGAPTCSGRCAGRSSNHSGRIEPAGALDVTEHPQFAELMKRCPHAPRIRNALGSSDPNHFSAQGN